MYSSTYMLVVKVLQELEDITVEEVFHNYIILLVGEVLLTFVALLGILLLLDLQWQEEVVTHGIMDTRLDKQVVIEGIHSIPTQLFLVTAPYSESSHTSYQHTLQKYLYYKTNPLLSYSSKYLEYFKGYSKVDYETALSLLEIRTNDQAALLNIFWNIDTFISRLEVLVLCWYCG